MASTNYMDDTLYEAARWSKGTELPDPPDDDDGFYYHRATPGDGSTALHVAAQHGNHRFVLSILSRVDPKMILYSHNTKGETPLHLAAESGSVETVEEILKSHDAIIDYDDKFGNSCWRARDKQGDTPVHTALRFGHDQIALLMLERDLEYPVTLRNDVGESLAYVAAQNSCPQFLCKILNADGDGQCCISFSGPFGQTAFHPARKLPGMSLRTLKFYYGSQTSLNIQV